MPVQEQHQPLLEYMIEPYLDPDLLREDGNFKAQVLKEFPEDGDVVNLKPVLRSYVESLGAIQDVFRREIEPQLVKAYHILESAYTKFVDRFSGARIFALAAISMDQNNKYVGEVIYVESTRQRLLDYFGAEEKSMDNFRHRFIKY
jgi:hypothetical protein